MMKRSLAFTITALLLAQPIMGEIDSTSRLQDTWINWQKRLDRASEGIPAKKIPGRVMGILVPQDPRFDLLPMAAFGYQTLSRENLRTVIFLLPTPAGYTTDGLVAPSLDNLETSIGSFPIDTFLVSILQQEGVPITVDNAPFSPIVPSILENQLALLKHSLRGNSRRAKILPIFVRFSDLNTQAKDIGPAISDALKDNGLDRDVTFLIGADLSQALGEGKLVSHDNIYLGAIRNLDVDALIDLHKSGEDESALVKTPNVAPVALGLLTLRFLGADHGEIFAYAHSGQLVLTKNKDSIISYAAAGIGSGPPYPVKIPHVRKEKLEGVYDELLRSDLLAISRQTCASILDPTAAKPPALVNREAAKKWPLYISLYTPEGNLGGQAGSHVPVGPLEESIRRFAFEAVKEAKGRGLSKENFKSWVVDVSIPHGFNKISRPEDLIPLLNGLIVTHEFKKAAYHPDAWRQYPDPHQLLGSICTRLSLVPWAYATDAANLESFRILAFNEKDPYQTLAAPKKKKKKSKESDDDLLDDLGGDGGGGGGFPF